MSKLFSVIAALAKPNRAIGFKGDLPWGRNLPSDLKYFNKVTTTASQNKQNMVIMGRKTWESLPDFAKPLPNRYNIVVSTKLNVVMPFVYCVKSFDDALYLANKILSIDNVFVIGGQKLYETAINHPLCQNLFLTEISKHYDGDTFFPEIPQHYKQVSSDEHFSNKINSDYSFNIYRSMFHLESEEYRYLNSLRRIMKEGEISDNRTGIPTISKFDENLNFTIECINPEEKDQTKLQYRIPALTTKKMLFKSIILELIWFLNGFTNSKWLEERGVKIWKGNSSRKYLDSRGLHHHEEGELGPVYGHQWVNWGGEIGKPGTGINQIKNIIEILRKDPTSRRALFHAWNVEDLDKMALPPCHVLYSFKVSNHKGAKPKLNCKVLQRSGDMFLGVPFNIMSAAILTIKMSRVLGMLPGQICISITDAHIYTNHKDQVNEQLQRTPYQFPILTIDKEINEYEDMCNLSFNDFKISEYRHWPRIQADMAV